MSSSEKPEADVLEQRRLVDATEIPDADPAEVPDDGVPGEADLADVRDQRHIAEASDGEEDYPSG